MTERTLDRIVRFDEQSRAFPMSEVLREVTYKPRSYTWNIYDVLDQGEEGACVGFGCTHELMARPAVVLGLTNSDGFRYYNMAKTLDAWEGENYDGTSVIAGAKAIRLAGFIKEFRWIFADPDEVIKTLGYFGPIILGVYWHQNMFDTNEEGMIYPTGPIIGGHCIIANGIMYNKSNPMKSKIKLQNSWGTDWGVGGSCYMYLDDLINLVRNDGEMCVFVGRSQTPITR